MIADPTTLYYFTGTGNSLKIAKDIARNTNDCAVFSIAKLVKRGNPVLVEGKVVGFVFPVYFARPPAIVQEFIERADFGDVSYTFAVANGGGLFGHVLKRFEALLRQKGVRLDAGYLVKMPSNHPMVASMQKKPPGWYFQKETSKVQQIVAAIQQRERRAVETSLGIIGRIMSHWAFKNLHERSLAKQLDKDTWVDERCINCSTCEGLCPVGNIANSSDKPEWQNRCVNCAACFNSCPQGAIHLGNLPTEPRYRNPEISLQELSER